MKVEIEVDKQSLSILVDGYKLDVYKDLESCDVDDATKKYVWLSSIAFEVERRLTRFTELEEKEYMSFWREYATKWLKVKDMKDTMDLIDSTVSRIFGNVSVSDKIAMIYSISSVVINNKHFERWGDFFNDPNVNDRIKDFGRNMYRLEFEKNMTYDKLIDLKVRMIAIVKTVKAAAEGYRLKSQKGKNFTF